MTEAHEPVAELCATTLGTALRLFAADVAVFDAEGPASAGHPIFRTEGIDDASARGRLSSMALDSLHSRLAVRVDDCVIGEGATTRKSVLALPAFVGEELVGVVVLVAPEGSIAACAKAVQPYLFAIALGVDRHRALRALERRGEEITALRQQLDAYAIDFRSTYRAERERAQQLTGALTELEATYLATVQGLAIAVEAKDAYTGGHLQRVTAYGMMLMRLIAPEHADDAQFEYGFLLHDIGKLTVPDVVLGKAGPLTPEEWEVIRDHPAQGCSILSGIPFLAGAREIVMAHHEHWDGSGYPRGLVGEEIPLGAQIFPLCDAFDAMTSDRPYRRAMSTVDARAVVAAGSGSQFWPTAVEVFLDIPLDELDHIRFHEPLAAA